MHSRLFVQILFGRIFYGLGDGPCGSTPPKPSTTRLSASFARDAAMSSPDRPPEGRRMRSTIACLALLPRSAWLTREQITVREFFTRQSLQILQVLFSEPLSSSFLVSSSLEALVFPASFRRCRVSLLRRSFWDLA